MYKNMDESSVSGHSDGQTAVPIGRDSYSTMHVNDHVVVTGQSNPESFSWCALITSVFAMFCCQPFGLISLVMALLSYSDYKVGHTKMAASKRSCALGFGIAAIVITVIAVIIGVIVVAVVGSTVVSTVSSFAANVNQNGNSRISFNG